MRRRGKRQQLSTDVIRRMSCRKLWTSVRCGVEKKYQAADRPDNQQKMQERDVPHVVAMLSRLQGRM